MNKSEKENLTLGSILNFEFANYKERHMLIRQMANKIRSQEEAIQKQKLVVRAMAANVPDPNTGNWTDMGPNELQRESESLNGELDGHRADLHKYEREHSLYRVMLGNRQVSDNPETAALRSFLQQHNRTQRNIFKRIFGVSKDPFKISRADRRHLVPLLGKTYRQKIDQKKELMAHVANRIELLQEVIKLSKLIHKKHAYRSVLKQHRKMLVLSEDRLKNVLGTLFELNLVRLASFLTSNKIKIGPVLFYVAQQIKSLLKGTNNGNSKKSGEAERTLQNYQGLQVNLEQISSDRKPKLHK